jgi:hypothetical protein
VFTRTGKLLEQVTRLKSRAIKATAHPPLHRLSFSEATDSDESQELIAIHLAGPAGTAIHQLISLSKLHESR